MKKYSAYMFCVYMCTTPLYSMDLDQDSFTNPTPLIINQFNNGLTMLNENANKLQGGWRWLNKQFNVETRENLTGVNNSSERQKTWELYQDTNEKLKEHQPLDSEQINQLATRYSCNLELCNKLIKQLNHLTNSHPTDIGKKIEIIQQILESTNTTKSLLSINTFNVSLPPAATNTLKDLRKDALNNALKLKKEIEKAGQQQELNKRFKNNELLPLAYQQDSLIKKLKKTNEHIAKTPEEKLVLLQKIHHLQQEAKKIQPQPEDLQRLLSKLKKKGKDTYAELNASFS